MAPPAAQRLGTFPRSGSFASDGDGAFDYRVLKNESNHQSHAAAKTSQADRARASSLAQGDDGAENENERSEFSTWISIAIPVAVTNLARTGCGLTDSAILGHFTKTSSTKYLFASSMGGIWGTLSMVIVWQGFANALAILMSQAWGAKNFRLIGIWLQTGLFICSLMATCIGVSWAFAGDIMQYLVEFDDTTKELVNTFGRVALLGLLPMTWYGVINNWLVSQKITTPQLVGSISVIGANVAFNFLFIYGASLGFKGSPLATAVSRSLLVFVIVFYLYCKKIHKTTWPGWTSEALNKTRLNRYLKLALPLALTGLLEEGQLQLVSIMAGRLPGNKDVNVATHNGIFMCFWVLTSIMWGVSAATRTRIAQHLGAGRIDRAKQVIAVSSRWAGAVGVAVALTFSLGRHYVGRIFSNDPDVWALTEKIAVLVGASYFGLTVFYICMSVLSAQGRANAVAIAFFVGAWGVTVPCVFIFGHMQQFATLFYLWVAMAAGYTVVTLIALFFVLRSNWEKIAEETMIRTEVNKVKEEIEAERSENVP